MTAPRFTLPALVLALVILAGVAYREGRSAGAAMVTSAARADTIALLRAQHDNATVRFRIDTVRLTTHETRYVTFRDTVLAHLTDTVVHVDTVRMLIARADSTIAACRVTVSDCEARAAAAEGLVAEQAKQIAALEHKTRHFWDRFGISAGYGLTAMPTGGVVHGVQIGASIRLWP